MAPAPEVSGGPGAASIARRLGLTAPPWWTAASLAALAIGGAWRETALVAVPEELLFRGLLQGELEARTRRPAVAIALAALAFALAHVALRADARAALTFFPGCLFGWLRWRSRSVVPAAAAHALANVLQDGLRWGGAGLAAL